nr:hypothetical protein [uncultured Cohaesibacter sp.]
MSFITHYVVQPGDELYRIMRNRYGHTEFIQNKEDIVKIIKGNNPQITNIDFIRPGQIIMLPDLITANMTGQRLPIEPDQTLVHNACNMSRSLEQLSKDEQEFMAGINWENTGEKITSGLVGSYVSAIANITKDAEKEINQIILSNSMSRHSLISRDQYNYRRRVRILAHEQRLGVLQNSLYGGKSVSEVLRINRSHGAGPYVNHAKQIQQIKRMHTLAKSGGALLSAARYLSVANEIYQADSNKQRLAIIAQTAVSDLASYGLQKVGVTAAKIATKRAATSLVSVVAGRAATVLALGAMATPAGWVGFTVMVVANVAISMAVDRVIEEAIDGGMKTLSGRSIDGIAGSPAKEGGVGQQKSAAPLSFMEIWP